MARSLSPISLPLIAAVSALALLPAVSHAAFSYGSITYTDIADTFTTSPYREVEGFPSINNAGQVGFGMLSRALSDYQYIAPASVTPYITVAQTGSGYGAFNSSSLNNAGVLSFAGSTNSGPNGSHYGIYTGNGGSVSTVADTTTPANAPYYNGGTPRISDNGAVAYLGVNAGGLPAITVRQGNSFNVIASYNGGIYENFTDFAINSGGQVVFNTDDYSTGSNNGAFVYRYTPGVGVVKLARAFTGTNVSINDAGFAAYQAAVPTGNGFPPTGIVASNGLLTVNISTLHQPLPGLNIVIDGYAANGEGSPINLAGMVAFQGSDNAQANYGIYVGDGTNTVQILKIGQTLFGKTVSQFHLGKDGLNDSGQLTFNAYFTDGTLAVVRTSGASIVPEPASALPLLLGGLLLKRRARRV